VANPATVEDVALRAGVSRQTVSNVLNKPEVVRESTRERVQRAIEELAYRPSVAARSLRTRRSSTIGIHLDPYSGGISGVVLDRFIHALVELSGERGLRVLMYSARSVDEEVSRLTDLVDGAEIDAAIVTGTRPGDSRTTWLSSRGVPFAAFGRPWGEGDVWASSHSWVDVDGADGTRQATAHAVEAHGPRVAWLGWPDDHGTGRDRESGWRDEMRRRGLAGRAFRVDNTLAPAREVVARALADTTDEGIDAIVCASDSLAVGAHLAAVEAGVGHIGIIGFDNTPVAEALGISSVEQSPELVAAATLDLLTDDTGRRVAPVDPDAVARVLVQPRLIVRQHPTG
jgi:DNA-binding LacI/PurR family transcriptional regulator